MAEYIEEATESEVRKWMKKEAVRLGDWLTGFVVTWDRNETKHWLEVRSETRANMTKPSERYGRLLKIGEVLTSEDWVALPLIQSEGRKLYYRLRNDFPVKRDLGGPKQ